MQPTQRPTPWQYLISILGAAIGVQSQATRERDFARGNPLVYILGGIAFVAVFTGVLLLVVQLVLKSAGLD